MGEERDEARYREKLDVLCQYVKDTVDPSKLSHEKWIDDINLWPEVEFGQIYAYLIDTPGQYTREKLKAYKSLDAFNYYIRYVATFLLFCISILPFTVVGFKRFGLLS